MRTTVQFRARSYDDWRAAGPHEDMPKAETTALRRPCETCGASVPDFEVVMCKAQGFGHWSRRSRRPY